MQGAGGDDEQLRCDAAFMECLPHVKCISCFATLQEDDVDWASVPDDTPCPDVITFLSASGKCTDLPGDQADQDIFCKTFDSCVIWEDDDDGSGGGGGGGGGGDKPNPAQPDCDALTSCDWDGIHTQFIGDGVCHDAIPGCYNSAICNYDGGDCCEVCVSMRLRVTQYAPRPLTLYDSSIYSLLMLFVMYI